MFSSFFPRLAADLDDEPTTLLPQTPNQPTNQLTHPNQAIDALLSDPQAGPALAAMYKDWPFFNTNLDLVDMILAKADVDIAGAGVGYVYAMLWIYTVCINYILACVCVLDR